MSGAYQLGRREGDDHFSILRVYEVRTDPFSGPFEEFLLGEPVHLRDVTFAYPRSRQVVPNDAIWWVQEFKEEEGSALAGVSDSRNKPTQHWVSILKLEKLPEMLRLAVEYAF